MAFKMGTLRQGLASTNVNELFGKNKVSLCTIYFTINEQIINLFFLITGIFFAPSRQCQDPFQKIFTFSSFSSLPSSCPFFTRYL